MERDRLSAFLQILLVTLLWSSSYILTKFGLNEVTPLSLVALRYITASIILLIVALVRGELATMYRDKLLKLGFLGVTGYSIAQGLQCLGLFYLPAVTVTFILNFTPIHVLFLSLIFLGERPTKWQLIGVVLVLSGAYVFFSERLVGGNLTGVVITLTSGLGWAAYLVSGRLLFRDGEKGTLGMTAISMSIGTVFIAGTAFTIEGFTGVSLSAWGIILWLGVVNTAFAFLLWNHALKRLEAFEVAITQNTMLIQIALLSWIFLGEQLTLMKVFAMALVFFGVLIVQLKND
jgi:drug/metabolite transporter (DMT)-like permease